MMLKTGMDIIMYVGNHRVGRTRDWPELCRKILPDYEYNLETSTTSGFLLRTTIEKVYEREMERANTSLKDLTDGQ